MYGCRQDFAAFLSLQIIYSSAVSTSCTDPLCLSDVAKAICTLQKVRKERVFYGMEIQVRLDIEVYFLFYKSGRVGHLLY